MNILDKAIAAVSPAWAARRVANRVALTDLRAYEAAKRDRNTEGWQVTGGSANAEIQPALDLMRRRSRDLVRNNPIATSAVRKLSGHIFGKGIVPRPATNDAKRDQLKENWATFVQHSDPEGLTNFYGQLVLAGRCVVEGGEALIRWHPRPKSIEFPSPLQCEILEPDFLDTLRTERHGDNVVFQGVEYDPYGRRVAYWLFDDHPGENNLARFKSMTSKRVSAEFVSPVFDRLRPGQVRGVPWFAPVTIAMRDLDDYEYAERLRKKIGACFSVFIKRDADADPTAMGQTSEETTAAGKTGRRLEKMSPGTVNYLRPSEDAVFATPPAAEGYGEYMVLQLHSIAAGLGVPYHMLTGDLRQANYSSLREGKLDFWSLVDTWQQFMAIPQACIPAWQRVNTAHARLGSGPNTWRPAMWQVPSRPWVDPATESEAEDLEFENGTQTWVAALHKRGLDPEEVLAELEEWAPRLAALGIDLFGAKARAEKAATKEKVNDETKPRKR